MIVLVLLSFSQSPSAGPLVANPGATATDSSNASAPSANRDLEKWLLSRLTFKDQDGGKVRLEIIRSPVKSRLQPCSRTEYRLPDRKHAWGRINVSEHCVQGAGWTIWHTVVVHIERLALIARRFLKAGSQPGIDDFKIQSVDWSSYPSPPESPQTVISNKVLSRSVSAGQPLLTGYLQDAPSIRSGQTVMVIAEGPGYKIATDGIALGSAGEGQTVRIRVPNGKVLAGTVEHQTVRISR